MSVPRITQRVARREYESRIAPRTLLRVFWQKQLHMIARATIPPDLAGRLLIWAEGYREHLRQAVEGAEQLDAEEGES